MADEINTIVDENDNVIGSKKRSEITSDDIYRVASLWLRNSKGQVLLARRAFSKSHDPGKWGPAVAGTVVADDSYLSTIEREAEEELGLTGLSFELGPKKFSQGHWRHYSQKFYAITELDINNMTIQKDEVEEIRWFDETTLLTLVKEKPKMFIETMEAYIS